MPTLLPPRVSTPLSECSGRIEVKSQVPGATVSVLSGNVVIAEGLSLFTEVSLVPGVALEAGQEIVAVQTLDGDESLPSPEPVIVQAKPPSIGTVVFDSTIYECGGCVRVSGVVPGAAVEVHATNGPHAGLRGTSVAGGGSAKVNLDPPAESGENFIGRQIACGNVGPDTPMQPVIDHAVFQFGEFSPPSIEEPLYACQQFVKIKGVYPGATVRLMRSEAGDVQGCFPFHTGEFIGIPLVEGESVEALQILQRCHMITEHSPVVKVKGVEKLPAPGVIGGLALCEGTKSITITDLIPGAIVRIFVDGEEIGIAGAPSDRFFAFPVPPIDGVEVTAQQSLCDNWSPLSNPVQVFHEDHDLSTPSIPGPLYECAGVVRVEADRGTWITVLSKTLGAPIGEGFALSKNRADIVVNPLLIRGDTITAVAKACGDESKVSDAVGVKKAPHLNRPEVAPYPIEHSTGVKVTQIVPGAYVEIFVSGFWRGGRYAAAEIDTIPITGELVLGDFVAARQRLCTRVSEFGANFDVVPPPPVAAFTADPASGDAPLLVQFTNHSTGNITSYEWFFNWKGEGDPSPDSVQESPSHNYTHKGSYTVMLVAEGPVFNNLVLHTVEVSTAPPEPPEPPEPPKASSIVLYNCHSDYQTLAIWVWDQTADTDWEQVGTLDSQWDDSGTCPVVGAPFTMELEEGHVYLFRAIETTGSCGDDPTIVNCIRWEAAPVQGDATANPFLATIA